MQRCLKISNSSSYIDISTYISESRMQGDMTVHRFGSSITLVIEDFCNVPKNIIQTVHVCSLMDVPVLMLHTS